MRKYRNDEVKDSADLDQAVSHYDEAKAIFEATGTLKTDEGAQVLASAGPPSSALAQLKLSLSSALARPEDANALRTRKAEGDADLAIEGYEKVGLRA